MKRVYVYLLLILVIASFLRLWRINTVPTSLFGDELDVGYQALSILKTGKDYYGNAWPVHFHSLAEWRTPLYLYSTVPTVAIWGISPLGVRIPAAIFGILGVLAFYLLIKEVFKNEKLALLGALFLAISPWHVQYSRAGFEVTEMILFLFLGLFFFFKSLKDGKYLWISSLFFVFMPWIYSTAKVFTPLLLLFLLVIWRKQIFKMKKKHLMYSVITFLVFGLPFAYSTFFGGGSQRFNYIGVFSDPTMESEIGTARQVDAHARGESGTGLSPTVIDKLFHNKFTFVGSNIGNNYFEALSTDFLFNNGDPNPRHSPSGMGEFYKVELLALIAGTILFFSRFTDNRLKLLVAFWILAGILPASLTRDGGNHSTRLILILPPLMFLISYGVWEGRKIFGKKWSNKLLGLYFVVLLAMFIFYQHRLWVHYPWDSERWWHYGWGPAVTEIKKIDKNYDKVILSTSDEPPWVFFAAWYEYPPAKWQAEFPIGNDVELSGFGKVSHIDKFYFGSPGEGRGLYDWGQVLTSKMLYLASAKEVKVNLIAEPDRTPKDLTLIKAIAYPSGEPAFYLFTGK